MSQAHEAASCPECERPVQRVVVAPNLALMAQNRRFAHQRNEKSAHEPRLETRAEMPAHGHDHQHHGHHHAHARNGGRPWMIGH